MYGETVFIPFNWFTAVFTLTSCEHESDACIKGENLLTSRENINF